MNDFARTRDEILGDMEQIQSDAAEIVRVAERVIYSDPRYDEDYKIREWFRIRPLEIERIRQSLAALLGRLEAELSRRD